jgi:predicted NBD/HSP70 family sugar kinase
MLLALDPGGACFVGVEINIDVVDVLLTDFVGSVLWSGHADVTAADSDAAILSAAEELVSEALARASSGPAPVIGLGVGVAALVDTGSGTVLYAPHLGWRDVPLGPRWESRFGVPVVVENEANAGALAEHHAGHAAAARDFVFVSLGVGLAAGVFVDGRLLRGSHGFAGQVGHTVRAPGGELCKCGRRGCWVTQVGLPAIWRRLAARGGALRSEGSSTAEPDRSHVTIEALADAAAAGSAEVLATLVETGRFLGSGIADLTNMFDPEVVVLGGALSPVLPHMLEAIRATAAANRLGRSGAAPPIVVSANGARGCAMGAMAAVFDALVRDGSLLRGSRLQAIDSGGA